MLLFSPAMIAIAQNTNISSEEKKQLENKFKALSNFYIDETGLVVYSETDQAAPNLNTQHNNRPIINTNSNNDIIIVEEKKEPYIIQENKDNEFDIITVETVVPPVKKYETNATTPARGNPNFIKNEPINPPRQEVIVVEKPEPEVVSETPKVETAKVVQKTTKTEATQTKPKGSIFDRKRQSQYKNMEEAALAVEALLDQLKKEQVSLKSSGSMSSRLSQGVSKDLRKNTGVQDPYQSPYETINPNIASSSAQTIIQDESSSLEPSYFINGVQVDKTEINKLTKDQIINREIRVRNTVTNNPNGEIWYTVKLLPENE